MCVDWKETKSFRMCSWFSQCSHTTPITVNSPGQWGLSNLYSQDLPLYLCRSELISSWSFSCSFAFMVGSLVHGTEAGQTALDGVTRHCGGIENSDPSPFKRNVWDEWRRFWDIVFASPLHIVPVDVFHNLQKIMSTSNLLVLPVIVACRLIIDQMMNV